MNPSGSRTGADEALQTFARRFFETLGAPVADVEPNLWQVELTGEQRRMLEPMMLPVWFFDTAPPETVRWLIAFSPEAAEGHPDAKLLTVHSQLFHQMEEACRRQGVARTGTLPRPDAAAYRPWLWLHLRKTRRGETVEVKEETWGFDLAGDRVRRAAPPDHQALAPGMPPAEARVEPPRRTPVEVWNALVDALEQEEAGLDLTWALRSRRRLEEDLHEIHTYYDGLATSEEDADAEALAEERARRLEEAKGRLLPRVIVEPVAAALVYTPYP